MNKVPYVFSNLINCLNISPKYGNNVKVTKYQRVSCLRSGFVESNQKLGNIYLDPIRTFSITPK